MTHEQALALLDDYVDGALPDIDRRGVHGHLEGCDACRAEVAAIRSILDEARFLPREVAPSRDLWAGIADRLEVREDPKVIPLHSRRRWHPPQWLLAVAASLVLVVSTAVVTANVVGRRQGTVGTLPAVAVSTPAPAGTAFAAFQTAERDYRQAIAELEAVLDQKRGRMAPETAATLEQNLRIIDEAIRQSREALAKDPNSRELTEMLSGVYEAKVSTLRQAVSL